jgi:hypothetical protein
MIPNHVTLVHRKFRLFFTLTYHFAPDQLPQPLHLEQSGGASYGFTHFISRSNLLDQMYRLTYRYILYFSINLMKILQPIATESILNINMLHRHSERGWNTGMDMLNINKRPGNKFQPFLWFYNVLLKNE